MTWGKTGLYLLTAASLAVNVFVLGIYVGGQSHPRGSEPRGPSPQVEFNVRQIGALLSEDGRRSAREILESERTQMRTAFMERRALRRKIATLLLAETVDKPALEAALTAQRSVTRDLVDPLETVMLEVVANESLEVRREVVKALFNGKKRLRQRRFPQERGRPPPADAPVH